MVDRPVEWMMGRVVVVICMTRKYQYAWRSVAFSVQRNLSNAGVLDEARVVLVGTDLDMIGKFYGEMLGREPVVIEMGRDDDLGKSWNYQIQAQLLIAEMRKNGFAEALKLRADFCWSLDSDVLPAPNSLRCSIDALGFDGGYYAVAACPYPSQGGGAFLCGHGDEWNPIYRDFLPEEEGLNVWEAIAKTGWRKRGWFDFAYPGIGLGAVVPCDWCGFGATLMDTRALGAITFEGYDGRGTEDLWVCYKNWKPSGLRIAAIAHCPASHVIRKTLLHGTRVMGHFSSWKREDNVLRMCRAYHETHTEHHGHLRVAESSWIDETPVMAHKAYKSRDSILSDPKP